MEELSFSAQAELTQLIDSLTALQSDASKFDAGNGAAGRRVRQELASLRGRIQALRFTVQNVKNQRIAQKKNQTAE